MRSYMIRFRSVAHARKSGSVSFYKGALVLYSQGQLRRLLTKLKTFTRPDRARAQLLSALLLPVRSLIGRVAPVNSWVFAKPCWPPEGALRAGSRNFRAL